MRRDVLASQLNLPMPQATIADRGANWAEMCVLPPSLITWPRCTRSTSGKPTHPDTPPLDLRRPLLYGLLPPDAGDARARSGPSDPRATRSWRAPGAVEF